MVLKVKHLWFIPGCSTSLPNCLTLTTAFIFMQETYAMGVRGEDERMWTCTPHNQLHTGVTWRERSGLLRWGEGCGYSWTQRTVAVLPYMTQRGWKCGQSFDITGATLWGLRNSVSLCGIWNSFLYYWLRFAWPLSFSMTNLGFGKRIIFIVK